ncbi:MAG TPA: LysE family transporter [Blastocatellia bacterium]
MDTALYIKSVMVGVIIALPVGPVGALSVRRVLTYGRTAGLVSALGATLADLVYVIIVRLGLTEISGTLMQFRPMLKWAGFAVILAIGIRFIASGRLVRDPDGEQFRYDGIFTSAFFLSVLNPTILFSLAVIFAGTGLDRHSTDRFTAALVILAVFGGSLACWVLLTALIDRFRQMMTPANLDLLGRVTGGLIIALGVGALLHP